MNDMPPINPDLTVSGHASPKTMTKVWCRINTTLHVPGAAFNPRLEYRGLGSDRLPCALGFEDVRVVLPNTPVQLDADEADRLIQRWGGSMIVDIPPPPKEL